MYFITILILFASFPRARQASTGVLAFTQVPAVVVIGQPTTLKWVGGDDSLVSKFDIHIWKNPYFLELLLSVTIACYHLLSKRQPWINTGYRSRCAGRVLHLGLHGSWCFRRLLVESHSRRAIFYHWCKLQSLCLDHFTDSLGIFRHSFGLQCPLDRPCLYQLCRHRFLRL